MGDRVEERQFSWAKPRRKTGLAITRKPGYFNSRHWQPRNYWLSANLAGWKFPRNWDGLLGLFGNKRFVKALVLLSVIIGGVGVVASQFTSTPRQYVPNISKLGPPSSGDPQLVYSIWHATAPQSNLGEFQTTGAVGFTGSCLGSTCIDLHPSVSQTQIALSKSPVGDLSVAAAKQLLIDQTVAFTTDTPTIDGLVFGTCTNCQSVLSNPITTSGANDMIVVIVLASGSTGVTITDTAGLSWTQRNISTAIGRLVTAQYSNGVGPLTNDKVNATINVGGNNILEIVFGVGCTGFVGSSCGLTWDSGGPASASNLSNAPTVNLSTNGLGGQLIIGELVSGDGNPTVGAGYTVMFTGAVCGCGGEYQAVTGAQVNLPVNFALGSSVNWSIIADAIDGESCCPASPVSNFGWYLTTNSTLPSHDIGSNLAYSPADDPSVVLLDNMYTTGSGTMESDLQILRTGISNGTSITTESVGCATVHLSSSGACYTFTTAASMTTGTEYTSDMLLNFTGGAAGGTACNWGAGVATGAGCSFLNMKNAANGAGDSTTLPWFSNLNAKLYIGFFARNGNGFVTRWVYDVGNNVGGMAIAYGFNCSAANGACGNLNEQGFFGPLIKALVPVGVLIFNAVLGFISFVSPAIIGALSFLESIVKSSLNGIGLAFGFPGSPGLGDDIFTFINSVITLFTIQVPNAFGQIGPIFSGWINTLQIIFTTGIIGQIFAFLSSSLTFGINIASFAFTIWTKFNFAGAVGLPWMLFFMFLIYNADDGMNGWIKWFQLVKWIAFDIGVKNVTWVINWTIDVITAAMALLPKPFVNMAGKFPRVPILDIHGSFIAPEIDGQALKEGNLFSILGMLFGFAGMIWYEFTQTGIPGTWAAQNLANNWCPTCATNANTALVFYELFMPMAGLIVIMLLIPTLFSRIFGYSIVSGVPSIPISVGRGRSAQVVQGRSGPLIRARPPGKRTQAFIKSRLEKIEGKEQETKMRNAREQAEEEKRKQEAQARREAETQRAQEQKEREDIETALGDTGT